MIMVKYMIHACPQRMWYVTDYMIPILHQNGIADNEIHVWCDTHKRGNLRSFFDSMEYVRDNYDPDDSIWHLQDDVLLCTDFVHRTKDITGCAYGFTNDFFNPVTYKNTGVVRIEDAWTSFQCVRIPNRYAGEFLEWYQQNKSNLLVWGIAKKNIGDDTLFNFFLQDWHRDDPITNVCPNLVEHVDFLLGGSTLVSERGMTLSFYWEEQFSTHYLARCIHEELMSKYFVEESSIYERRKAICKTDCEMS